MSDENLVHIGGGQMGYGGGEHGVSASGSNELLCEKGVLAHRLKVGQRVIKHDVDSADSHHTVTPELLSLWRGNPWFESATFDILSDT